MSHSEPSVSIGGEPQIEEALPHKEELAELLAPYGQQHLLAFWDTLSPAEQSSLAGQVRSLDLPALAKMLSQKDATDWASLARRAQPPQAFRLSTPDDEYSPNEARHRGEELLSEGKVGVVLVAGGEGTRLGFNQPKGMYSIGPVSHASLFQILFEKIFAIGARYRAPLPVYVMTSPATHNETVEYLNRFGRFGLEAEDVVVFCQGTTPVVDAATGKMLLAEKSALLESPDGHGGFVRAAPIAHMERRGVEHLFYMQVDNPLVSVCDPVFLGFHFIAKSQMSTQAVAKTGPLDRVGNIVSLDGKTQIIEYSDLPNEAAERRTPAGDLELWAGNTAIHAIEFDFLRRASEERFDLPIHIARKRVEHIGLDGNRVSPREENALKFEKFIFDLLPLADRSIVVEINPEEAFAPLKNEPGAPKDSPETVRAQMMRLHRKWLREAGAKVGDDTPVEISPRFALDAAEVKKKVAQGTVVDRPRYFR